MFDPIENIKGALKKASKINPNAAPSIIPCVIARVDDPERRCRVQVQLRGFEPYATNWVPLANKTLTNGVLPSSLVGVSGLAITQEDSLDHIQVYLAKPIIYQKKDQLPDPCLENHGEIITMVDFSESLVLFCVLRNGVWVWEPISPLGHVHVGGDFITQGQDSSGDIQQNIEVGVIHDQIAVTTVNPYTPNSKSIPPVLTPS